MTNLNNTLIKTIKKHKVLTSVISGLTIASVTMLVAVFCNAQYDKQINNTQKALEIIAADGVISTDDLQKLEEEGGFADFGTEVIDPQTGETIVLTQDSNGNIIKTVIKDAQGNETGASLPASNTNPVSDSDTHTSNNEGSPTSHQHVYIPHYSTSYKEVISTIEHPAEYTTEKYSVQVCNECGAEDVHRDSHFCNGGMYSSGTRVKSRQVLVRDAWAENVVTQEPYQYIDYYYCSSCGQTQ